MGTADLGTYPDLAGLLDDVVDGDVHVWKCGGNTANDRLDARRAWSLAWRQRNILPVRREDRIHQVRVLFAERAIQRFDCDALGA